MDTFDIKTWLDKETVEILFSEKANFMEKHLHDTEDGFMKDLDGSLCSTVTTLIEDESMSKSDQWRSAERLEERTGKDTSEDIRQSESVFGQLKNKIKQRKLKQEEKSRKYHFQLVNTPVPKLESRTTSKRPSTDSKKQPKPAKCKDYSIFAAAPTAL
ncbi:hypothetical protein DPEC_G00202370 [Dallia pectoralis]|uniref:Uncharacterized protein n=1 Tax=Dallia pectoralis TaxID=75939 RepID=A0ACC2G9L8_DALPE|nr:hypothetical protein DPEC_G00202370 [Dallia pectoralis]